MPKVKANDINMYYEIQGEGEPLVLIMGLGADIPAWFRLLPVLSQEYQVIAFDARGHGKSDKPHQISAYGINMAEDAVSVLDDIGIRKAHYFGYSLGARIGFRVATRHTDRFDSFILGGASPYRGEAETQAEEGLVERMRFWIKDSDSSMKQTEQVLGRSLTTDEKNEMLSNDYEALIAVATSLRNLSPLTNHELSFISAPCLLYCGEYQEPRHEGAKESVNHIPQAQFVSLPLDHVQGFTRSDLVLPHIKEFLTRVSK